MSDDLTEARRQILQRASSASGMVEHSIAAAQGPSSARAFVSTSFDGARQAAAAADRALAAGRDPDVATSRREMASPTLGQEMLGASPIRELAGTIPGRHATGTASAALPPGA